MKKTWVENLMTQSFEGAKAFSNINSNLKNLIYMRQIHIHIKKSFNP
jgi:hypothetical protein